MDIHELKARARESLKGNYKESIKLFFLCFLVCIGITVVFSIIEENIEINGLLAFILAFIPTLVVYGLYPGFYSFFLKISRNEEVSCKELFKYRNLFLVTIGTTLMVSIFIFLGTLLFIIPGIIKAISYSMAFYVLAENPNMSATEALNESKAIMEGHKMDYFVLSLSFIPWYLLVVVTFGIAALYVGPYISLTTTNFYHNVKRQQASAQPNTAETVY